MVPGSSCTVANMPLPFGWSGRMICSGAISARNAFWMGTGSSPACSAFVPTIAATVGAGGTADKATHAGRGAQEIRPIGIRNGRDGPPQPVGKQAIKCRYDNSLLPGKGRIHLGGDGLQVWPSRGAIGQDVREGSVT